MGTTIFWCHKCKRYTDDLLHACVPRFCLCEGDYICPFHKRGGYVTTEDDRKS